MTFAMLVAGLTEVPLFPAGGARRTSGRGFNGGLQGLVVRTPMTFRPHCIVAV